MGPRSGGWCDAAAFRFVTPWLCLESFFDGGFFSMIQGTVYIVDDDAEVRNSLQCVLESDTRRVAAYASASDFLADFQHTQPSCLLLDLRLPGSSGEELLELLRTRFPDLPVIVITGHADVPTVLRTLRRGVVDFCTKPLDLQTLLPMVDRELAADAARAGLRRQVAEARQRLAQLTPRERELFELVVAGKSYKEMAAALGISPRTVEHHRAHIITKIGMDRVADMVRLRLFAGDDTAVPELVESPI
jgi:two-component system, LuxR family, response regulator FixJ